ncbi:MAG: hypothetical protein JSV79_02795 [Armatimonadota bacterium]|nr:MAG: hypothetical protein JSV79_02795 [Armatimonadota bacterium]
MTVRLVMLLGLALLIPVDARAESAPAQIPDRAAELARDPYAYSTRQRLVAEARAAGDYPVAYYHAAWLAWLAPRRSADSDAGLPLLRDKDARKRAAYNQTGPIDAIIAAVEAKQLLANTCLNGAVAQQAGRLRANIADLLARAEEAEAQARHADPAARIALAQLCLSLDDALTFEGAAANHRLRLRVLQQAASRASAVAAWLPECPGPRRTLAAIRARLAELDNRSDLWGLAIADAERAFQLDPDDRSLLELLWVLNLRAGRWTEAASWQARVEPPAH